MQSHTQLHPVPRKQPTLEPSPPTLRTRQAASAESLIIAADGPPLWGLLVRVTSYVRGC